MRKTYWLVAACSLLLSRAALGEDSCDKLRSLTIPNTSITLGGPVEAGKFAGPTAAFTGRDLTAFYKNLPAFCRVLAEAKPTSDSDIRIEIWMPLSDWNGKLQGIGNGGFAGLIDYQQLGDALSKGYAATATDTGHSGNPVDAKWALGHPEKIVDFGHRGIHEMTRVAKEVLEAYYGKGPQYSYFAGCSDGGREALMEAQRYPQDFDGILAGAPANYWTALLTMAASDTKALTLDPASYIPPSKIPAIAAAVNAACDQKDGVQDGVLNDPRKCQFDPAVIECKGGDSDKCLTAAETATLKKLYAGPHDAKGKQVFPGFLPGAEDGPGGWAVWILGTAPEKSLLTLFAKGYFGDMVYDDANWDAKTFSLDAGLKAAQAKTASALDAVNPDLKAFKARGGKLIVYHGWNDPAIPPVNTVNYYESVIRKMGQKDTDSFLRLYMVPGMQHCGNGPGADSFGQVGRLVFDDPQHSVDAALEQWVEKGTAPGTIIASKYSKDAQTTLKMTRPLCAYPRAAKYKGSGDTNDAANFVCQP